VIVSREERLREYFDDEYFKADPDLWERIGRTLPFDDRARRLQRRGRMLLAVAVLVLLAALSAVPTAASATPIAPIPRAVLAAAGLESVTERFMPVQGSATWSGITINLVAAYADDVGTVVVLRAEPRAKADGLFPRELVAVDSSGHFLGTTGGTSLDGGNYVLRFDPLPRGQSSPSKLTLFIWQMDSNPGRPPQTLYGLWSLQFTVTSHGGHVLPLPAPGQTARMSVTFNSVKSAPSGLAIDFTTHGVAPGAWCSHPMAITPPPGSAPGVQMSICPPGAHVQTIRVFDPPGHELHQVSGGSAVKNKAMLDRKEERWTSVWPVTGPGTYRIIISDPDGAAIEREIQVP
jgi:hypothetical protein